MKFLVWDLKANTKAENAAGLTPMDYCKKFIDSEDVKQTIIGLLQKQH